MKKTICFIAQCALLAGITVYPALAAEPCQEIQKHTVKWGDTLAKIAHRYYGDGKQYPYLVEANKLGNPHRIICGKTIDIPPLHVVPEKAEAVSPDPAEIAVSSAPAAALPDALSIAPVPLEPVFTWRQEQQSVLGPGEKLTFSVRWKFISVGSATMEISGIDEINGRKAFHIVTSARSSPFFDTFYKVRDVNESWMDAESLCSLKFASHTDENNNKKDETIHLDHPTATFRIEESGKTGETTLWAQDVLSALYYLRTKPLEIGKDYLLDAHSGDKSWPLKVNVLRYEKVKVPAGEFECVVVEPAIREGAGIFQAKGSLQVWLTADERRMPVLMRSKIAVGSIEALLTEIKR